MPPRATSTSTTTTTNRSSTTTAPASRSYLWPALLPTMPARTRPRRPSGLEAGRGVALQLLQIAAHLLDDVQREDPLLVGLVEDQHGGDRLAGDPQRAEDGDDLLDQGRHPLRPSLAHPDRGQLQADQGG